MKKKRRRPKKQFLIKKFRNSICKFGVLAIGYDKHGHIVCIGQNLPKLQCAGGGIHAEQEMFRKATRRKKKIVHCLLIRINNPKTGKTIRSADPCPKCIKLLNKHLVTWETIQEPYNA